MKTITISELDFIETHKEIVKVALSQKSFNFGSILPKMCQMTILSSIHLLPREDAQDSFGHNFWEIRANMKNFLKLSHRQ